MPLVFTYGTLRPRDTDGEFLPATHQLEGYGLYDYGAFPFVKELTGGVVYGNILEVTARKLRDLDYMEGVSEGYYSRIIERVRSLINGELVVPFVYVGRLIAQDVRSPSPLIRSGDWHVHEKTATPFVPFTKR